MYVKHVMVASLAMMRPCDCDPGDPGTGSPDGSVAGACLEATSQAVPSITSSPCPIITCGDNAPTAGDGLLFDELDLSGGPNYAHVHLVGEPNPDGKILSARFAGTEELGWVDIDEDKLIVHDADTGLPHQGNELIGTVITLQHDPTGVRFELRVACYDDHTVKFLAGTPEVVPEYDFQARRLDKQDGEWFHVCNQEPLLSDMTWTNPHHALVYRGDRYDPHAKRLLSSDRTDRWAFIACNGSAGSKMHLYRHTDAGSFDDAERETFPTSLDERTTLLKAITADYCGFPRSASDVPGVPNSCGSPRDVPDFTVAGQPLAIAISSPTMSPPFPYPYTSMLGGTEAVWGPCGAICLNTPRLPTVPETMTSTRDAVNALCPKPMCDPSMVPPAGWEAKGHVVTVNPDP